MKWLKNLICFHVWHRLPAKRDHMGVSEHLWVCEKCGKEAWRGEWEG